MRGCRNGNSGAGSAPGATAWRGRGVPSGASRTGLPTAEELVRQAHGKLVLAEEMGIENRDLAGMVHGAVGCLDVGLGKCSREKAQKAQEFPRRD